MSITLEKILAKNPTQLGMIFYLQGYFKRSFEIFWIMQDLRGAKKL